MTSMKCSVASAGSLLKTPETMSTCANCPFPSFYSGKKQEGQKNLRKSQYPVIHTPRAHSRGISNYPVSSHFRSFAISVEAAAVPPVHLSKVKPALMITCSDSFFQWRHCRALRGRKRHEKVCMSQQISPADVRPTLDLLLGVGDF